MNLLKTVKLWFTNDWKIVEVINGRWEFGQGSFMTDFTELVSYTFYYSKRLNKYKLEISGHKPEFHPIYSTAIKRLNEYESNTTTTTNS